MAKIANILFPADYFNKNRPDEALRIEYEAALSEPRFDVLLFDLEAFEQTGDVKLTRQPVEEGLPLIYRGWMLKPLDYDSFISSLPREIFKPLTHAAEYAEFHMFPLAYGRHEGLREAAPKLLAFPDARIDAGIVNAAFDRFMVKDYVKSAKQTAFPSCIRTPIEQSEADALVEEFIRLRGGLFTGGIVCKEYVDLAKYGGATNEWRAFFICGGVLSVCRNSNQPSKSPKPPEELVERFADLGAPYYTVDFAEKADGSWMVVETGDGQVSGLAASQDPVIYYAVLADALEEKLSSWPTYWSRHPSFPEKEITPEDALEYVMAGGDFGHVSYPDERMSALLAPDRLKLWHGKKVEYLQGCDDRHELGCTLAESGKFIIHSEFETVWITFKGGARNDVVIGDFYGDPYGAAIAPDESTCAIYGCGVIIYRIAEPFEEYEYDANTPQWFEFGREPDDITWFRSARYVDAFTVELKTEDGETITIDTQTALGWKAKGTWDCRSQV